MAESKGFIPDVYMNTLGNSKKPWENVYAKGITTLLRKHVYEVGEIAFHADLPTWAYLECVKSGLTGESVPTEISKEVNMNDVIRDNVAEWEVRKIGGNSLEGLGLLPTITVTSIPDAIITVQIDGTEQSKTVGADGVVTFNAYKLGVHTVSGTHKGIASMNTEKVDVQTIAKYNTTISFFSATLNITVESGATITVTDGDFVTKKTSTGSAIPFTIYNKGVNVKAVAKKNNVNSNIQSFTFSTNGESKAVTLKFVKLTVTEEVGTAITVSRNSYTYSATIGSSGSALFYLPEIGTWSIVGIKGDITRNDTIAITKYNDYSFSFFNATLNVTVESGAVITLTDGTTTATKTSTGSAIAFTVRNKSVSVYATKSGIRSNTQAVTFVNKGESKSVTLSFIKLTVTSKDGATVRVSKGSYSYSVVIGSSKTNVFYLPEVGTWSVVGTYIRNEQSVTKTKVANITAYGDYSVSVSGVVYAVYVDQNDIVESTCVHQVQGYDNYGFKPIKMNFTSNVENNTLDWGSWKDSFIMPKPCMLKHDGTVAYYLNPNDYTKKEDGSASDVSNTSFDGEAMMEWVPIFMKVVNDTATNRIYLYFSDNKEDNSYECYSALKADGTYAEHFYTPIYEGSIINNKMRSLSTNAKPTANTTMDSERTAAKANGTGWDITCWADEDLLRCLGILVTGRLNSEVAIGNHCGEGSSLTHNCGSANKKGIFFGHSGTSAYATKYFGMENWWGHRWRRCTGLLVNNYKVYVKMTKHTRDGSKVADYSTSSVDGYIDTGVTVPSANGSYIKTIAGAKNAVTVPTNVSGASATTGYCDGMWSSSGLRAPLCGGDVCCGSLCGLFALGVDSAPSISTWHYGASLSYKTL